MPGPRNPLRDHLMEAAAETARSALDYINATGRLAVSTAAIHAGMSVEFLLRASVADLAPALLFAARTHTDSVMRVMVNAQQQNELDLAWVHQQRTTDAATVRAAAEEIIPGLIPLKEQLSTLVKHRDSAVHMYSAEAADVRQTAATLTRIASLVLAHLRREPEDFWERPRMDLVQALREEQDDLLRADVAVRVRGCGLRAAQLAERLTVDAEFVFQQMEGQGPEFVPLGWMEKPADCPACERLATLWVKGEHYHLDLDDIELEFDEEGLLNSALVPQDVSAVHFTCRVCRLGLNDNELRAAYPHLRAVDLDPVRVTASEYGDIVEMYLPH